MRPLALVVSETVTLFMGRKETAISLDDLITSHLIVAFIIYA